MPTLELTDQALLVRPAPGEKVAGLLRDLDVPLASIRSAVVVPDGLAAAKGLRAPGLGVPFVAKIGTWRRRGGSTSYVVARRRASLVLRLEGQPHDTVVVTVDDPEGWARQVRERIGAA